MDVLSIFMGRKKLKLRDPVNSLESYKNFSRRFPCLLKKSMEMSKMTNTKVFLLITDDHNRHPLVFATDYLDCIFASYEKNRNPLFDVTSHVIKGSESDDFEFRERVTFRQNLFYPFNFSNSFIPVAKIIPKYEFKKPFTIIPKKGELVAPTLPTCLAGNKGEKWLELFEQENEKNDFPRNYEEVENEKQIWKDILF